jgi:hypothetical protein
MRKLTFLTGIKGCVFRNLHSLQASLGKHVNLNSLSDKIIRQDDDGMNKKGSAQEGTQIPKSP